MGQVTVDQTEAESRSQTSRNRSSAGRCAGTCRRVAVGNLRCQFGTSSPLPPPQIEYGNPGDFFTVRLTASKPTRETHFFTVRERKPISLRLRAGVAINRRIASKTTLNCLSYWLSSSSNRRESSALDASICRSFTNARMISMLTVIAHLLRNTLDSMATPCSVKA